MQKRENILFLQPHNSGTAMNPELIPGMAKGRSISKSKYEVYRYRS